MRKIKLYLLVLFFCLLNIQFLYSQSLDLQKITPQDTYGKIFTAQENELTPLFSESFLKALSTDKIAEITKQYESTLGKYMEALPTENGFKLIFQKGNAPSTITFNEKNQVASIWFGVPNLSQDSFENISEELKKMPGKVSICLLRHNENDNGEEEIFTFQHKLELGVGSSFKLYLLKALDDAVSEGEFKMSDLIALKNENFSFPSGILQEWPAQSQHTLDTLAGLMISLSDNTATDHIFNLLGEQRLRDYFPKSCKEMLNTSQFIKLKFFYKELAKEYVSASQQRKEDILREIDGKNAKDLDLSFINTQPQKPFLIEEIEWQISTLDLCRIAYSLRENRLLRINPAQGITKKADWHIVGFKGGSEPGVLNFTWVVQRTEQSPFYTLSCTANNSEKNIDLGAFSALAVRLLNMIPK